MRHPLRAKYRIKIEVSKLNSEKRTLLKYFWKIVILILDQGMWNDRVLGYYEDTQNFEFGFRI